MTKRRHLSARDRVKVFENSDGKCHLCGVKIQPGERWEADHDLALALGGSDDIDNLKPAHASCHKGKSKDDNWRAKKADRQKAKHLGHRKRRTIGYRRADGTIVWPD